MDSLSFVKGIYQDAVTKSGQIYSLSYEKSHNTGKHKKKRQRNIMWYNPTYSKNVETNVGKCFLSLVDPHFPKSNPLHKIFNRNTIKVSYSHMNDIKTVISGHNTLENLNHLQTSKKLVKSLLNVHIFFVNYNLCKFAHLQRFCNSIKSL